MRSVFNEMTLNEMWHEVKRHIYIQENVTSYKYRDNLMGVMYGGIQGLFVICYLCSVLL